MTYSPKQSFGLQIKLRTATGSDAVKASRTMGATSSQLVVTAKTAGAAGNNLRFQIVNPGVNTADPSVVVTGNDIVVTASYSSSAIDCSVNEIIAAIYASSDAAALIDASNGAGDGTGLIAAYALANLASGADATHTYEVIKGVGDVTLPGENRELIDITSHSSPQARAEFVKSVVKEGAEFSFPVKLDPTDSVHIALKAAEASDSAVSMQFIYPNSLGGYQSDVLVTNIEEEVAVRGIINATVNCRMTGARVAL